MRLACMLKHFSKITAYSYRKNENVPLIVTLRKKEKRIKNCSNVIVIVGETQYFMNTNLHIF